MGIPQDIFQDGLMKFIQGKDETYAFTHQVKNADGEMQAKANFKRQGNKVFLSSVFAKSSSGEARFPVGQRYPHINKMNRLVNRRHDQPVSVMIPDYINSAGDQKRMWVTMMNEKMTLEDKGEINKFGFSTKELPAERYGHKFTEKEKADMEDGKSVRLEDCELSIKQGDKWIKTGLNVPQEVWPNMLSKKDCIPGSDSNTPVIFGYKPEVDVPALIKQAQEALAAGQVPVNPREALQGAIREEPMQRPVDGGQPNVQPSTAVRAPTNNAGWQNVPEVEYNYKFSDQQRKDLFEGKSVIVHDFKYWDKKKQEYTGQVGDVRFQWQKVGDGFQLKARAAKPEEVQEHKRIHERQTQPEGQRAETSTSVQASQQSSSSPIASPSARRKESEMQPQPTEEQPQQKRRGRPVGSKNKPKDEGEAARKPYSLKAIIGGYEQKVDDVQEQEQTTKKRISQ
ncbi:MAG TPA: DUF3945 domain-containing protein [Puia sp.]|nr:DUF3945 domain-containing protein [Puia sp.]